VNEKLNEKRIFVAGATGVLGWRAVDRLVQAGHTVTGLARSPEKAARLRSLGAGAVEVDLFDRDGIREAVAGAEVVCNLATHIPRATKARRDSAWAENDRIRREGARNLVDAALATGAGRYIQESITFIYAAAGDRWIDEDAPLDVPDYASSTVDAEHQVARFTDAGGTGVVLRFGLFYGPDSHHTIDGVRLARRRVAASFGSPDTYMSSINTDDAAAAVVAALDAPAGVYNVVDDEPLSRRDTFAALADALGVRPPRVTLAALTRLGGEKTATLARSQRVSNERFKQATGWSPANPSVREGWPAVVAEMAPDQEQAGA
jgi:nucleoside-diphosphate-sugar epimerase